MVACPHCGTENPVAARFCNGCGGRIDPGAALPEERRTVTVLFADLAGFTARSDGADPEDVRRFLRPYYEVVRREVARHGGTVERFLGDGVLAVFGAPEAHEDDPERAVRAGLRTAEGVEALGLGLRVRIGVNTGEVLFAAAGEGRHDDALTGDAVNTAARLQAAAEPGAVSVGEATFRLVERRFRWRDEEPLAAKGKAEPVRRWTAVAPVARSLRDVAEESTALVGRAVELEALEGAFERAAGRRLEVMTVVAEPGLGKSRLVREFARRVDAGPRPVTWLVGRCLPYGDGAGFWPLGEAIGQWARILETDPQAEVRSKLEGAIAGLGLSSAGWIRDRVGPLVGLLVDLAPPEPQEAYAAWSRLLEGIAARGPAVLVVEDLHWASSGMVDFLAHLASRAAPIPLLVLATARPEVVERHPGWLDPAGPTPASVRLGALGEGDVRAMAEASMPGASGQLLDAVVERASGSPLFAEQLAALHRERDGAMTAGDVPPTLAALLASRIDALPAASRPALLDASVVGKVFWSGAVAAAGGHEPNALGAALADVARHELARPSRPSSLEGELEYAFWHALLRDAAYARLPRARRLERHVAVAAWLRERPGGSKGRVAEIEADHLERALELALRSGEPEARVASIRSDLAGASLEAARHALATAPNRALPAVERALGLLPDGDPRRTDALEIRGRARATADDFPAALPDLEAAFGLLRDAGRHEDTALVASQLALALHRTGQAERSAAVLDEAEGLLGGRPSRALALLIARRSGSALYMGLSTAAEALADQAIDVAEAAGVAPPARAVTTKAFCIGGRDPERAESMLREAVELALGEGDRREAATALINRRLLLSRQAGPRRGRDALREQHRAVRDLGLVPNGALPAWEDPDNLYELGLWDDAVREAEQLLVRWRPRGSGDIAELEIAVLRVTLARGAEVHEADLDRAEAAARDDTRPLADFAGVLGLAHVGSGDRVAARRLLEDALAGPGGDEPGNDDGPALVKLALALGDRRRAELAAAASDGDETLYRTNGIWARALLLEADGRPAEALPLLRQAADTFGAHDWVVRSIEATTDLGRCELAAGEGDAGIAHLLEARAAWEGLGANARIAEIDALLERFRG